MTTGVSASSAESDRSPPRSRRRSGLAARYGRLSRTAQRIVVLLAQFCVIVLFLLAWQGAAGDPRKGTGLIDEFFIGVPSRIWATLLEWLQNGIVVRAAWVTLQETVVGLVIGSVAGMALGFALGASRVVAAVFSPLIYAAYSVPRLALVPMFILWFGLGMTSKVAMVTLLVFFLTFFSTFAGAREVDAELIAVTRLMGASRWQIWSKVTLPSAVSWVTVGLQISVPYAFVGAIVAEIVAGNEGLGNLITRSSNQFDPNGMFAAMSVAMLLSIAINGLVDLGSGYLLRWRSADESTRPTAAL